MPATTVVTLLLVGAMGTIVIQSLLERKWLLASCAATSAAFMLLGINWSAVVIDHPWWWGLF